MDNVIDRMNKGRHLLSLFLGNVSIRTGKLSVKEVLEIKTMTGLQKDIARKYDVSQQTISAIKTGARWGSIV